MHTIHWQCFVISHLQQSNYTECNRYVLCLMHSTNSTTSLVLTTQTNNPKQIEFNISNSMTSGCPLSSPIQCSVHDVWKCRLQLHDISNIIVGYIYASTQPVRHIVCDGGPMCWPPLKPFRGTFRNQLPKDIDKHIVVIVCPKMSCAAYQFICS